MQSDWSECGYTQSEKDYLDMVRKLATITYVFNLVVTGVIICRTMAALPTD
jgi:hypothetical protein